MRRARSRQSLVATACLAILIAAMSILPTNPAAANPVPSGNIAVTVKILRWSDQASYPFTVNQVRDTLFDGAQNTSDYFTALTNGDSALVEVTPIEQIPSVHASTDPAVINCDPDAFLSEVPPVPPGERLIVITPHMSSCPGNGLGDIPGTQVFINGVLNWRLMAHELLHNQGLNHAGACTSINAAGDCSGNSYGDPFDVMGASTGASAGFPSAFNLMLLEEIASPAQTPDITSDGVYKLKPANQPGSGVRLLAIPRPGGQYEYLILETRVKRAYDNFRSSGSRLYHGVSVRLASLNDSPNGISTLLVPANPKASTSSDRTSWPLGTCEVYKDGRSGASIRLLTIDSGIAKVQVAVNGHRLKNRAECQKTKPKAHAKIAGSTLKVSGKKLKFSVKCSAGKGPCKGKIVIKHGKKTVAKGSYKVKAKHKAKVKAKLTAKGKKVVKKGKPKKLKVFLKPKGGGKNVSKKLKVR